MRSDRKGERFLTGLDVVLSERSDALRGRVGLVTHPAALSVRGAWSADALRAHPDIDLRVLLGPEHGVLGHAGAGEPVASRTHPAWGLPMYSLYGDQRRPTPSMLADLDVVALDLQDLGVRCYTYASTLLLVMEAAADLDKRVVVLDRPVPLPDTVDGPPRAEQFVSFVAQLPTPMVYGMTPGETARFLHHLVPSLDLEVIPMGGYHRGAQRPSGAPPWVPPSPGIRSWDTAQCYPATVCCEALPGLDFGAGTFLPFERIGAPWLKANEVIEAAATLPGLDLHAHWYYPAAAQGADEPWPGIRLVVSDPSVYAPICSAVSLLFAIQRVHGRDRLWSAPGTREDFFDTLFGTDQVRKGLQSGRPPTDICGGWTEGRQAHLARRAPCLLYSSAGGDVA